ncbi:MAG: HEAT repeat domain-containing protein, partial [Planctomycetota bacterium]
GTGLEVYCTGTRNHLDVAIDAEDEMFTYDNTDDGHGWWTRLTHMVDGGFYGYPWDYKPRRPYTLWMMTDYGGGSGTASIAYTEDALPEEYRGNLFLSDWARREVLRVRVAREGGSFRVVATEKFLRMTGPGEFRPVGLAWSAEGRSLYVCDWQYGGWKAKVETGRLLKVTYTGPSRAAAKPVWFVSAATGKPFEATDAELAAALGHSSHQVRLVAQRRLADRKAIAALEGALVSGSAVARRHAVWGLDALGGSPAVLGALSDPDAGVRRQAVRQLGTRAVKEAVGPLVARLRDPEVSVRFHAATALGRIGDSAAIPALREALAEKDLCARYAAFTALNRLGRASGAWGEIVRGLGDPRAEIREGTRFALRETYDERLVEALAVLAASEEASAGVRAEALAALAELHRKPPEWTGKWWGTQPVAQPRPARTVPYAGTARVLSSLREALRSPQEVVRLAAAQGCAEALDPEAAPVLRILAASDPSTEVRRAALRALGALRDAGSSELVARALGDPAVARDAVSAAERIGGPAVVAALIRAVEGTPSPEALAALGRLRDRRACGAVARCARHADSAVAKAAIAALELLGGPEAQEGLLGALEDARAEVRRTALGALAAGVPSRDAVPALLKAYLDPETRFEAIEALARVPDLRALEAYLEGLGGRNAALRQKCREALRAIAGDALKPLEELYAAGRIGPEALSEIQRVYNAPEPVRRWRLLGPFAREAAPPFPVAAPPADGEYEALGGRRVRWKEVEAEAGTGRLRLNGRFPVESQVAVFAVAEVDSPVAREAELVLGSDDSIVVWVNGEKVFEDLRDHGWQPDQFRTRAKLRAGKNVLVVHCGNTGGGWDFSVALPGIRRGILFESVPRREDPRRYAEYARRHHGDAARGRMLFMDPKGAGCIKCHKVGGQGGEVGPDLSDVGVKYGRDHFIDSILYPSKQILDGYRQTRVLTRSGTVLSGRVAGETAEEIVLLDAEGRRQAVRKSEIEGRRESELSLMPEGLNAGLSLEDFADLVAFLESLRPSGSK